MASYSKVTLLGNLTRDVELRYTPSETPVAEIGLAVNEKWKDKTTGQLREDVCFVDVTLWGRTAEIAGEYLKKGSQVLIEGKLKLDQWNDKQTGQKRQKLKVTGTQLVLLGSKGGGSQRQSEPPADHYEGSQEPPQSGGEEVPF